MKLRLLIIVSLALFCQLANGQVRLPQIIRDSMVLQRNEKIKIWGWASKAEMVKVSFNRKTYSAKSDNDGKWMIQLSPMSAGGPFTMEIKGKNKIILKNILIGDVWLCSGQSNMVHQLKLHNILYAEEIQQANYPEIRQFQVPNTTNLISPATDLIAGYWKSAVRETVSDFSAVAYFFAKKIYERYHVPIGIINASWGGTPIESWMSEESLQSFPSTVNTIATNKDTAYVNVTNRNAISIRKATEPSDKGLIEKWFDPLYIPNGWRTIAVPGYWEDQGIHDLDGSVWYRKEIDVAASMIKANAKLFLGRIVDADECYVNGQKIGATGYMYPQRRYAIPNGLLKEGKNIIVIRVTNNAGKGGFVSAKPYQLISGKDTIDLTGYWNYKVGQVYLPDSNGNKKRIILQNQPTALYNAMLAPITNYTIKGFAWYQGESNIGRAEEYSKIQLAMIDDWRKKWQQGNIPFLFTQLPGFMDYNYLPVESEWANFREAQAKSLSIPNTAMAVTIDLGEWNDIHPDNKKDVGERLALAALKIVYGENIVHAGPVFKSASIDDNKIIIEFNNVGSGLTTTDNGPLQEFAIAGTDKKFVWANATIDGNRIILSSDEIKAPKYIRYAWADNPVNPNLINKEGLPAAPFRTDTD